MRPEKEAYLTQERRQRAAELERLERAAARYDHPMAEHKSLLARLFHHGNTPWTAQTTRRRQRRLHTTAEILRASAE